MRYCIHERFRQQVRVLRRQFLQDGDLPFTAALSEATITTVLKSLNRTVKELCNTRGFKVACTGGSGSCYVIYFHFFTQNYP